VRAVSIFFRQGRKEAVNHHPDAALTPYIVKAKPPVMHSQLMARRDHIDNVRLELLTVFDLGDRHLGVMRQKLIHDRGVIGREVLDDDVGHAAVGGDRVDEFAQRFQPTR
jgi:hypothetical protein